jgi:N-acetylmuramoyl-L-alanine amidase
MKRRLRGLVAAILLAIIAAVVATGAPRPSEGPEPARVEKIGDAAYVGVNDLARLLEATKFWRSDVRKLVLRAGEHRVQLTVDLPYVLIDDRTVRLDHPVRSRRGEVHVPVALLDSLPVDESLRRVVFDSRRGVVLALPAGGVIRTPAIEGGEDRVRVVFPVERVTDAVVAGRARARLQFRLGGFFTGVIRDSVRTGLLHALRVIPVPNGSAFELEVDPAASGYRVVREEHRITLELVREPGPGLEEFAAEGPTGPRPLRVIVLDPGHGGEDAGVQAGGVAEKDLALEVARALKPEIERRVRARVILTRDRDVALSSEQRAEAANRARADLVISLHFDGYPSSRARGATATVAPATVGGRDPERGRWSLPVEVLPWRDVALRHAVPSRALAEVLRARLELAGQGPVRIRERLPVPLLGVNAPGVQLELATLTSQTDRARITSDGGVKALAVSVAEAVAAYQRND